MLNPETTAYVQEVMQSIIDAEKDQQTRHTSDPEEYYMYNGLLYVRCGGHGGCKAFKVLHPDRTLCAFGRGSLSSASPGLSDILRTYAPDTWSPRRRAFTVRYLCKVCRNAMSSKSEEAARAYKDRRLAYEEEQRTLATIKWGGTAWSYLLFVHLPDTTWGYSGCTQRHPHTRIEEHLLGRGSLAIQEVVPHVTASLMAYEQSLFKNQETLIEHHVTGHTTLADALRTEQAVYDHWKQNEADPGLGFEIANKIRPPGRIEQVSTA